MRNKCLAVVAFLMVSLVVLTFMTEPKKDHNFFISPANASEHKVVSAEVVNNFTGTTAADSFAPTGTPVAAAPISTTPATEDAPAKPVFPPVWQRDKTQYASDAEWKTWANSSCSAASLTSVLVGYGHQVKISDVLNQFEAQNAIKSSVGLYKYNVFSTVASEYGLKVAYSEDKNLDAHFNRVMDYLRRGVPVIVNVLDATYFPSGHFVVATGLNADGTVAIMNPDPADDKGPNQNWTQSSLKLYFSRMTRSAAILP